MNNLFRNGNHDRNRGWQVRRVGKIRVFVKRWMPAFMLICLGVLDLSAQTQNLITLPPHSSVYTGYSRGFYFTAPIDMFITGVRVPTDASATGNQAVEILRFTSAPPISGQATQLGYWPNVPGTSIISTSIMVNAGEVIAVLGNRFTSTGNFDAINSYGNTPHSATIGGFTVPLYRFGFQNNIANIPCNGNNIISSTSGQIGRVEVYWSPPIQYPIDLRLNEIMQPTSDCGLNDIEPVKVALKSFSMDTLNPGNLVEMFFSVNGGPIASEHFILSDSLYPLDTVHYTFSATADLSGPGQDYDIRAWLRMVGDGDSSNDTLEKNVLNSLLTTFPQFENFEQWSPTSTTATCGNPLGIAMHGWESDTSGDGAWNVNSGLTPTSNTGPFSDYSPGTFGGKYLYVETSSPCTGSNTLNILSPCLDMRNLSNPGMNLAYHMYGTGIGSLLVDVILDDGTEFRGIWQVDGQQGQNWRLGAIDLSTYAGFGTFRVRLRAETSGEFGDIAVDDIRFGSIPNATISADTIRGCGIVQVSAPLLVDASYVWSTGANTRSVKVSNPTSAPISQKLGLRVSKGGMYNIDSVVVILDPGPVLDLPEYISMCDQDSLILDSETPGMQHLWDNGATTQRRTVYEDGSYYVRVNDGAGCVKRDTVDVDFGSTPVADFTFQNITSRSFIQFDKGSSEGDSYLWDFGDGNGATVEDPTHYYTAGGSYTVTLIVSNNCGADTTSQVIDVWFTGVDGPEAVSEVRVFPNPAMDQVRFQILCTEQTQWTVQLMNLHGQVLEVRQLPTGKNVSGELSVQDIPAGYYLIEMRSELGKIVRPLVVQ